MIRVACIGECMIELRELPNGHLSRGYGGDTLNTAVYLARLGVPVDYVTALGQDPWSDEMIDGWQSEGIGTRLVARLPNRLPGLYVIQTDSTGERRFSYWRDSAAARSLFDMPATPQFCEALAGYEVLYLSGITLSLYHDKGRDRLIETLEHARKRGARVVFDTNFRQRGWRQPETAQAVYRRMFARSDTCLASTEDLQLLFGSDGTNELLNYKSSSEIVLKSPEPSCRVLHDGTDQVVPGERVGSVVDTTAAGDSFAAAYLAARLAGCEPAQAARAGHRLASIVVRYPGALIPQSAMPAMTFIPVEEKRA